MKTDALLEALGELARKERDEEPAPLAAAAEGIAPPPGAPPDPGLAPLLRPPRRAALDRAVEIATAGLDAGAPPRRAAPAHPAPALRRWRRYLPVGLAPLALAAAALLLWARGAGPALPALPAYDLAVRGGVAELRAGGSPQGSTPGDAEPPLPLAPGARLELWLTPAAPTDARVEARLFWLLADGAALLWDAEVEAAPGGALRARGLAPASVAGRAVALRAIVGPAGAVPADGAEAARTAGLRLLDRPVRWR